MKDHTFRQDEAPHNRGLEPRSMTNMLVKLSRNEKLSEKELEEISELQKKVDFLIKGGAIGKPGMKSNTFDLGEKK